MIDIRHVTCQYGSVTALDSVRAEIGPGEIVGIFGANGAGKTTLLKCVSGMMRPTYGSVLIDDVHARLSRKVSFMAQEGSSFPDLTIADHHYFLSRNMPDFRADRFERLVSFFDLPRERKLSQFSTGQRSSFELCCGLSLARPYLVMDEPFLGHDLITRQNTLKLLAGLLGEQDTLILSTHQVQEVEPLISRAIVLNKGRITADVQMEDLRDKRQRAQRLQAQHLPAHGLPTQGYNLQSLLEFDKQTGEKKLAEILDEEWRA